MPRETKEIALPSGAKVTVYTYLTGGEANAIKAIMMSAMKVDIANVKPGDAPEVVGEMNGTILMEQEKLMVKSLVKECSAGAAEDLRASDYTALVEELNKIKNGPLDSAK